MTHQPLYLLLEHNAWATHKVIDLASRLTPAQRMQEFPIGLGSLAKTLWHVVEEMEGWTDLAREREPRKGKFLPVHDPETLRQRLDAATRDIRSLLGARLENGTLTGETTFPHVSGQDVTNPHVICVLTALVHGTHHRAQCLNMLRQLNVAPLPSLDVCDWYDQLEKP
jgi:uncharacterized damage-inducible protein DinB